MRFNVYRPVEDRGEFRVRDDDALGADGQPMAVCLCWTLEEAKKIAAALNDVPKLAPVAAFGMTCIEWFAVDGCVPLSPSALCDEEKTFQERARELISPKKCRAGAR